MLQLCVRDLKERPSRGYYVVPHRIMPVAVVRRILTRHLLNENFASKSRICEVAKKVIFVFSLYMLHWNFPQPKVRSIKELIL